MSKKIHRNNTVIELNADLHFYQIFHLNDFVVNKSSSQVSRLSALEVQENPDGSRNSQMGKKHSTFW